jgi:hypothetical protein
MLICGDISCPRRVTPNNEEFTADAAGPHDRVRQPVPLLQDRMVGGCGLLAPQLG